MKILNFSTQKDSVPITFSELIPKDKMYENDSVSRNDVRRASRYVQILMDSSASASIITICLHVQINFILEKHPRISSLR